MNYLTNWPSSKVVKICMKMRLQRQLMKPVKTLGESKLFKEIMFFCGATSAPKNNSPDAAGHGRCRRQLRRCLWQRLQWLGRDLRETPPPAPSRENIESATRWWRPSAIRLWSHRHEHHHYYDYPYLGIVISIYLLHLLLATPSPEPHSPHTTGRFLRNLKGSSHWPWPHDQRKVSHRSID